MVCVVLVFDNVLYCLGGIQDQHVCANLFGLHTNVLALLRGRIWPYTVSSLTTGVVLSLNLLRCQILLAGKTFQAKAQLCWLALQSTGDQQLVLDTLFLDP